MALKAPAEPPSPWDVAITGGLMSDYYFRGITQSNHRPSIDVGFEPRYDFTSALQGYAGISGESIDFPNRAAAEIDFYGGIRPTFGKLALDFGVWDYYYPAGQCFNTPTFCGSGAAPLPNGNVVKQNLSFYEGYGKATYTVNDNIELGGSIWGSPSVLNSGAYGVYYTGNVTLTAPATRHDRLVLWRRSTAELLELGCRRSVHLEGVHARSSLLPVQPDADPMQRLHQ